MIKKEILDKRSLCHCLLNSTTDPQVIIPIKGVIEEVYFEEDIPVYSIRIIKFYDTINFLKANFIGKSFLTNYKGKPKPIQIPKSVRTVDDLNNWLGEQSKYRFCVDSNLTFKLKNEMFDLYQKIQEYLICQKLREVREILLRPSYKGPIRLNSKPEWDYRMERAFSDLFNSPQETKDFISTI